MILDDLVKTNTGFKGLPEVTAVPVDLKTDAILVHIAHLSSAVGVVGTRAQLELVASQILDALFRLDEAHRYVDPITGLILTKGDNRAG